MPHTIEWRCPSCLRPGHQELGPGEPLRCRHCRHEQPLPPGSRADDGALRDPLQRCLACGSRRLYVQKDFNRRLGLAIVAVGAVLSPWTYGLSLLACLLIDYALYFVVPEITVCYGCDAIHRGFGHNPAHRAYDPLLAGRFRRQAQEERSAPGPAEGPGPTGGTGRNAGAGPI